MNAAERLGIGLAAVGRPAYINVGRAEELPQDRGVEQMRHATWSLLDGAYAAGIRWVDTARSYGRAEEFLGEWLAARVPDDLTISSKWGYTYVGDWRIDAPVHEVKEHTADRYRAQYAETRALLGDRLSVYQVHSLTPDSLLFDDAGLQETLAEAAAEGVRVGFSTSGPRQADTIRRALQLEVSGSRLFSTVQSTWNLLETSAGAALEEAHAAGLHAALFDPYLAYAAAAAPAAHGYPFAAELLHAGQEGLRGLAAVALAGVADVDVVAHRRAFAGADAPFTGHTPA